MSGSVEAQRTPVPEARPVAAVGDRWIDAGSGARVAAFASHSLDASLPDIELAVIVVHGLRRDADASYANMMGAVRKADAAGLVKAPATLVIAPQFLITSDARAHPLPPDAAYWTNDGWKGGEPAVAPASRPSSFAALDALVERFAAHAAFPSLRRIVVAGHSAGGQILHRYAVTARADAAAARAQIDVRFIVANPSTYLYLTAERPTGNGTFAPYDGARCPGFDRYRFGLAGAPAYVSERARDDLVREYRARRVIYMLGTADNDPDHRVLDRTCAAMAQGAHRLARGEAFHRYVIRFLGPGAERTHRKVLVDGVGHDSVAMWASPAGQAALFGPW